MKRAIRLTESDLHRIVKKSVNRILKEALGGETASMLGDLLTDLDADTAHKVADTLQMHWGEDFDTIVRSLNATLDPTPYETSDDVAASFYEKFGNSDIDDYAQERMDLEANYDDFPPMK